MRKTIDWKKIWNKLNDWWQNSLRNKMSCKTCGHVKSLEIDWDEQQAKIQQLVNAQVREIINRLAQSNKLLLKENIRFYRTNSSVARTIK